MIGFLPSLYLASLLYRWGRFEEALYVNNWLLPTNLYPVLRPEQIRAASAFLVERFPDRPIVFRSVDERGAPELPRVLEDLGYRMVFSRLVYYVDPSDPEVFRRGSVRADLRRRRKTPYAMVRQEDLSRADVPRLRELYRLLYLEKHTRLNPAFTEAFLRRALEERLMEFRAFRREGRIDAMVGYFVRNGVMTRSILGYDTRLPQELGLYGLVVLQPLLEARERGWLVNLSGGTGRYKRSRGGERVVEYHAVYDRHLPRPRRLSWGFLKWWTDRLLPPLLRRLDR
jgi:hypothetical protein